MTSFNKLRVAVIGGGFGGLSAAALLAKDGCEVTLLEKNSTLGGRAHVYEESGFTFDMGPSWYLMPDVFENYFKLFGKEIKDLYDLIRLDPSYQIFMEQGKTLKIPANLQAAYALFESFEVNGSSRLRTVLERAAYQYRVAMKRFIYRPYIGFKDLLDHQLVIEGMSLGIFGSLDSFVRKHFRSLEARQILEYSTVFLGSDPTRTPAMYALMAHVDFKLGVWYPRGGMGSVVNAFVQVGRDAGVIFKCDEPVTQIVHSDGQSSAVVTSKAHYEIDVVIAAADYHHVETQLLEQSGRSYNDRYWRGRTIAPSALLFYIGVNKKIPNLEHHSLYFTTTWEEHFETIFSKPAWPDNFSYYICCPSKTDPSVAPLHAENIFVLVPVAAGLPDSDETRERYFNQVVAHIEKLTGVPILEDIIVKKIFSQRDFKAFYNSFKGTALGLAHTLRQTALFRPRMRSKKIKNLFFTGHYTHPGIGVPMVVIASQIAVEEIKKSYAC